MRRAWLGLCVLLASGPARAEVTGRMAAVMLEQSAQLTWREDVRGGASHVEVRTRVRVDNRLSVAVDRVTVEVAVHDTTRPPGIAGIRLPLATADQVIELSPALAPGESRELPLVATVAGAWSLKGANAADVSVGSAHLRIHDSQFAPAPGTPDATGVSAALAGPAQAAAQVHINRADQRYVVPLEVTARAGGQVRVRVNNGSQLPLLKAKVSARIGEVTVGPDLLNWDSAIAPGKSRDFSAYLHVVRPITDPDAGFRADIPVELSTSDSSFKPEPAPVLVQKKVALKDGDGKRAKTLLTLQPGDAVVEVASGSPSQVRTADGTLGWIDSKALAAKVRLGGRAARSKVGARRSAGGGYYLPMCDLAKPLGIGADYVGSELWLRRGDLRLELVERMVSASVDRWGESRTIVVDPVAYRNDDACMFVHQKTLREAFGADLDALLPAPE